MALRRLKKDGLVRVETTGEVRLTAAGRKIARKLTLRHHLIERMLSELFGMEWWKVHDEAERLEHAVSPDFEAKLLAKLGSGGACPHGNLSELEGPASRRRRGLVLLADAALENTYTVSGIYERDRQSAGISRAPRRPPRSQTPTPRAQLRPDSHTLHSRRNGITRPCRFRARLALTASRQKLSTRRPHFFASFVQFETKTIGVGLSSGSAVTRIFRLSGLKSNGVPRGDV